METRPEPEPERQRGDARASLRLLHLEVPGRVRAWVEALEGWPDPMAFSVVAALLAAVAVLHGYAGQRFGIDLVYLLPVGLAAWRWGRGAGALWAVAATGIWLVVHPSGSAGAAAVGWSLAVHTLVFLAAALVLAALRDRSDTIRTLAGTDHLTGVQSPRAFQELVELERSRALRYDRPFTLAYLDIDGFRRVNKEWGHTAGDRILRLVASTIRDNIRSMDSVCRMGGDEFALLFPETGKAAADVALHKIQSRLVESMRERSLALGFTIGAVIFVGAPESVDDLIERAETLMYEAKGEGGSGLRAEVLDENYGIEAILQRG